MFKLLTIYQPTLCRERVFFWQLVILPLEQKTITLANVVLLFFFMGAAVLLVLELTLTCFIFGVDMNKHCQDIMNTAGINETFKSFIMPIKVW